jgi:hypothetical protein
MEYSVHKGLLIMACATLLLAAAGCSSQNAAVKGPAAPPAQLPDLTKNKPANMSPGGGTMPSAMPGGMPPGGMAPAR